MYAVDNVFIDVCIDIYVMMSSDLYGTCSHCIYGTRPRYWPTGSDVSDYTGLTLPVADILFYSMSVIPLILCVCVCVCVVSVCVCLSVQAITFECIYLETLFFVWWYIWTTSSCSLRIKVIGSMSKLFLLNGLF